MPEYEPRPERRTGRGAQDTLFRLSSAGILAAALVSFLLILLVARGQPGSNLDRTLPTQAQSEVLGAGAEEAVAPTGGPTVFALPTAEPDIVPDLVMEHGIVAVGTLRAAEMPYFVIEVANDDVPPGTVFQQSPTAGTKLEDKMAITLVASR